MNKGKSGGGGGSKKPNKPAPGPDIPSSNLMKNPSYANRSYASVGAVKTTTERNYANVGAKPTTTAPPTQAIHAQDPARLLSHLSRVDQNLKEIIGPTAYDWKKLAEQKKKEEYARLKAEHEKRKQQKLEEMKNPELAEQRAKQAEEEKKKAEEAKQEEKPKKIFTDSQGRLVDEEGNIVNLKQRASLKINLNKEREKRVKDMLRMQKIPGTDTMRNTAFFDPNLQPLLQSKREKRRLHAFHFIEKGSISQQADTIRKNEPSLADESAVTEAGDKTVEEAAPTDEKGQKKKKNESSILQAGLKRVSVRVKRHDPIPDVEWWDAPFLKEGEKSYLPKDSANTSMVEEETEGDRNEYGSLQMLKSNLQLLNNLECASSFKLDKISALVEHPAAFRNNLTGQHIIIPTYLTKDERKKSEDRNDWREKRISRIKSN